MSDITRWPVVVVADIGDGIFVAYFADREDRVSIRRTKNKAVGQLVKLDPTRFGLPGIRYIGRSEEFGAEILANPNDFGVIIADHTV